MKRLVLMAALATLCARLSAQGNLVPNGSFEDFTSCPDFWGGYVASHVQYWNSPNTGSPDYFNFCGTEEHQTPPSVIYGYQFPRSGDGFIGMYCFALNQPQGREYIQIELSEPIYSGVRYKVSFYASLADMSLYAISSLGAYLSEDAPSINQYWLLDVEPQVLNPSGNILTDTSSWVLITDTFASRAGGGEKFLTIGNFNYAAVSDTFLHNPNGDHNYTFAYYYIDDVSVIALDSVPSGVGIHEVEKERVLKTYPNPTNGLLRIEYELGLLEKGNVNVYGIAGNLLLSQSLNSELNKAELNLSLFSSGIYLLQLEVEGETKLSERISILRQ